MKSVVPALAIMALTGCSAPSPGFAPAQSVTVIEDGLTFVVHRAGDRVEVLRSSFIMLPEHGRVLSAARRAIVRATGCAVVPGSLRGDVAMMVARLDCSGDGAISG